MERAEEVGREGAPGASALAPAGTHGAAEPGGAGNSCGGILGGSAALLRDLLRAGEGRAGEESGRAGRGGERAPAAAASAASAAAVLIPAAQRLSGRGSSQMACAALGLEALQPLQPEPPPEPAFSEAQKWIEVGARGWRGALQGQPGATDPHTHDRSSLASPHFLLPAAPAPVRASSELRPPDALALASRVRVGAKGGHCGLAVRVGGRKRSPEPPSLLPASRANLSSCRFQALPKEAQCEQKRRKASLCASPQSPCRRSMSGVLLPVLPPPVGSPSPPFRSGVVRVSTEAHTHRSLWLYSWHRVRCEAGTAQRAGEPARPTCECAIRRDVAQPLAAPTPSQRRWDGLPGAGYPAPLAYFTS